MKFVKPALQNGFSMLSLCHGSFSGTERYCDFIEFIVLSVVFSKATFPDPGYFAR